MSVNIHFSDHFEVDPQALADFGTVNISLISDLPLFLDPFLLFNSNDHEHRQLHDELIRYLVFLRDKAAAGGIKRGLLTEWFCFPEIRQLWMGYSRAGNQGSGLGMDFARKLHRNLHTVFQSFGAEQVSAGSHLEKLCLIEQGVGRDHIADFTANLILDYLCRFTARFASAHIHPDHVQSRIVPRAVFNYDTESWTARSYDLPVHSKDFVLLAPRVLLTKDATWINRYDLIIQLPDVISSVENEVSRAKFNNYLLRCLPTDKDPTRADYRVAAEATVRKYPELIEYFIRLKELHGTEAASVSEARVATTELQFIRNVSTLAAALKSETDFYALRGETIDEARSRVAYLKDIIESKGGWRLFYQDGEPFRRESDLQIVFRFTWCGTPSDISREVDDGRGPADFKVSRGLDKTIVEFKLASNSKQEQNLQHQTEAYQAASDAQHGLKVIMFYNDSEYERVRGILGRLNMMDDDRIILIDASPKSSASRVA